MRVITLDEGNMVTSVKDVNVGYDQNPGLKIGEIISDVGERGQIMQPDGTFITPDPIPIIPQPTIEERFAEVNANQLILMDVLATMYEDMLAKGTV